jgi:hypothetical protein
LGEGKAGNVQGDGVGSVIKSDTSQSNQSGSEGGGKTPLLSGRADGIETAQSGKVGTNSTGDDFSLGVGGGISSAEHVAWFVASELLLETREKISEGVGVHGDGGILGEDIVSDVEGEEVFSLEVIQHSLDDKLTEEDLETIRVGGVDLGEDSGISEGHFSVDVVLQVNSSVKTTVDVSSVDGGGINPSVVDGEGNLDIIVTNSHLSGVLDHDGL